MKRAILLLVVVVGGAFYLGWFTFTTDGTGPTEQVHIVINKDKVHQDEGRALEKLHEFEQQAEAQAQTGAAGTTNQPSVPAADRSADRRMRPSPQPISPYSPQQPNGLPVENGYQPLPQQEYAPAQPAPQAVDPYELPERPRAANRQGSEAAADSFSRGFQ
ncbi:MAG TPA: hypothetical protein VG125_06495 [Pirellulales bacterium]|jgi:hypothetical protein|nr:hypothetical protein [Pirellulales bacterium]